MEVEELRNNQKIDERNNFVNKRIEALRPKLLDLTRRNPLISTKFNERSNSLFRIINISLEGILDTLTLPTRISALPDLDLDPKDEKSQEFQEALREARVCNEYYLNRLDEIDDSDSDSDSETATLIAQADRELKDWVRSQLKMPPRQTAKNLSLAQHAKNNGICPDFELTQDIIEKNRLLQTLLLPEALGRKLNALYSKEKSWKEETGISVLHMALGFLEWEDKRYKSKQISPLLLLPVEVEKKRTSNGQEFWISIDDSNIEENKMLAEKLNIDFSIKLPSYSDQGIEKYLHEISELKPINLNWDVKKWAVVGVFPSARLAMYYDLDIKVNDFSSSSIVAELFGGKEKSLEATPFGEVYEVDEPKIESKVPCIITDVDSSQFSVLVDACDGKNLAVEGPPGTGKSQTIVNTIAALMASGKKVLFVAEKTAALEVVRARLEAFGLGDFVLSLQASRSARNTVVSSIRERMQLSSCEDPLELNELLVQYKKERNYIKIYLDVISSLFGNSDLTVYNIIAHNIKSHALAEKIKLTIKNIKLPDLTSLTKTKLEEIVSKCELVQKSIGETNNNLSLWRNIRIGNVDPFKASELLTLANEVSALFKRSNQERLKLENESISSEIGSTHLKIIWDALKLCNDNLSNAEVLLVGRVPTLEKVELLNKYKIDVKEIKRLNQDIMSSFSSSIEDINILDLEKAKIFFELYSIDSINDECLNNISSSLKNVLKLYQHAETMFQMAVEQCPEFQNVSISTLSKVIDLLCRTSDEALLMRDARLDDPVVQNKIKKAIGSIIELRDKKNVLEKDYILSGLLDADHLKYNAKLLSESGIFSVFSKNFRKAKKYYRVIHKHTKFNRIDAARQLYELSAWKQDFEALEKNNILVKYFKNHYDGLNTEFKPYLEAMHYYDTLRSIAKGSKCDDVKHFLKNSPADVVRVLSFLDGFEIYKDMDLGFSDIPILISEAKENLDIYDKALDNIVNIRKRLRDGDKITYQDFCMIVTNFNTSIEHTALLKNNGPAKQLLGQYYNAEDTDFNAIDTSLKIAATISVLDEKIRLAFLNSLSRGNQKILLNLVENIIEKDNLALEQTALLANETESHVDTWLEGLQFSQREIAFLDASNNKTSLLSYSNLNSAVSSLEAEGFSDIKKIALDSENTSLAEILSTLIYSRMAKIIYKEHGGVLSHYSGNSMNHARSRLQELDRRIIELSRKRLRFNLWKNAKPPTGIGYGKKSEYTELALLKNEISKKGRYVSLRSLTRRSGKALLELMPCWMMSPLAVSQYLDKSASNFDLVIIDEASQMTPEDSIGALLRAKQAMIVGDTNQLPPTSFFGKIFDDEDLDEDEKVVEESILEMANSCFTPARRLKWHYRSKTPSLIAFSNKHVYDNDLVIFPSPNDNNSDMGVSYINVDGYYSSGTNPIEARAIIDGIVKFMYKFPKKSLGVVVPNKKQCGLLADEMEYAIENKEYVKKYVDYWEDKNDGLESFFIKNLENVQGDERDVIFIGTVYGRENKESPVRNNFGPINGVAGKRRLNVLFTRAKERIVTYSSMTASDIKADEDGNAGAYMLKCWLEYSSAGLLESGIVQHKEPDSEFEEHVISKIKSMGCEAVPQVGVRGYSIDIGIKHADWPHGFIMGVECDGASYHSSKSARDRDRLRQEVLEGLGWYLYRIWSTDWFSDPLEETEKLRAAVRNRIKELEATLL